MSTGGGAAGAECPVMPDFTAVAGPYIFGHLLSFGLFGSLCVQIYMYHVAFKKDPPMLKAVVWLLFLVELTFQAIEAHMAWWSLGQGWGKIERILGFTQPTISFTVLTGFVTAIVHGFYSWRIIALSTGGRGRKFIIPGVIGALSLTQLSMTIYIAAFLAQHQDIGGAAALSESFRFITVWFVFAVAADLVITVAMTTLLVSAKRKTSYSPTATKVGNLIKYTVETGLVTSLGALLVLILFLAFKNAIYYYIVYYSLGKIYSNTLLATLNSRITFVTSSTQLNGGEAMRLNTRNGMWKDFTSQAPRPDMHGRVEIKTSTVVFNDSDGMDLSMKPRV